MKEPTFHPVSEMFPLLEGCDFEELVENIRENGQIDQILTCKGQIIDGRNRYLACKKLGIKPRMEEWDGKGSLVAISASRNLHRRHLTPSQRAAAGVEVEEGLGVEARQNQKAAGKLKGKVAVETFHSRDRAAKICRVSSRSIGEAKAIKASDPKVFAEVAKGRLTISQAKRTVRRAVKKKTMQAVLPPLDESQCNIICGDAVKQFERISPNSIDLVFADSPYNIGIDYGRGAKADQLPEDKFFAWCEEWFAEIARVLKPDGSAFVMIDAAHAADFGVMLSCSGVELHYRNVIIWHETFGSYTDDNFTSCARFIWYFTKSGKHCKFNGDAIRIQSDRQKQGDKRADPAGKVPGNVWSFPRLMDNHPGRMPGFPTQLPLELVERIVLVASDPGDMVLDPFVGSGTTAVAAMRNGRRFTGFDINAQYVAFARNRVSLELVALAARGGRK